MSPLPQLDRRTLLIGGGLGIGLVAGIAWWPSGAPSAGARGWTFGSLIKVARDGRVTVAVPQVETGQGIWTALPQVAADELGAAWDMVGVEPALIGEDHANALAGELGWTDGLSRWRQFRLPAAALRITAGSTSVRAFETPMREAAAAARELLVAEAAARWDVESGECEAAHGLVRHRQRTLRFGDLAETAAGRSLPSSPQLRSGGLRLTGKPLPRLDGPAKADGSFRFAADVRLPGMLFASARLAPPGGRLAGFTRGTVPGVRLIDDEQWLAALADDWWKAERALAAANARFSGPASADTRPLREQFQAALDGVEPEQWFARGDYAGAVEGARALAATYWIAPAQHLGLEPLTATARVADGRIEVWAPAQAPELARAAAEQAAGGAEVTLYPMPPGDSGGRALEADAIPLAVALARRTGRPVQVGLPPSASQNHAPLSSPLLARLTALPGPDGITAAWKMRVVTSGSLGSAIARLTGDEATALDPAALDGAMPPYGIPNVTVEATHVPLPFRAGYMRGHPQRPLVFAIESFADELARLAGMEPLAFRMAMLGSNPRLARCAQAAAARAGWDGGGSGSTMGLATASVFGSHVALVASATLAADQSVDVHRLVAAVDCGRIVNPGLVRQQVEGGLLWALGLAAIRPPETRDGIVLARPLGALGLPRIARTPEIVVELIASSAAPGGVSGLGPAILAPALANAIHAGTGRRLRSLPFDPMGSQ